MISPYLVLLAFMAVVRITAHDGYDHSSQRHTERCISLAPAPNVTAKINADIKAFEKSRLSSFTAVQSIIVPIYFVM